MTLPPLTAMSAAVAWPMRPSYRSPCRVARFTFDASQSMRNPPCHRCQSSAASWPLGNAVAAAARVGGGGGWAVAPLVKSPWRGGAFHFGRAQTQADPPLPQVPVVGGVLATGQRRRIATKRSAVDPSPNRRPQRPAVADGSEAVLLGPAAARQQHPLRVLGVLRDDVDDAIDRVGSPQRGPGPADDLDPVDVREGDLLHVPEHTGEERRVHGA